MTDWSMDKYLQGKEKAPMDAANMLWLIQRDFLEGASLQAMLTQALSPVDNPAKDHDIEQVSTLQQLHVVPATMSMSRSGTGNPREWRDGACLQTAVCSSLLSICSKIGPTAVLSGICHAGAYDLQLLLPRLHILPVNN